LRRQGAKMAQALLTPQEALLASPLERNGFRHITTLWYLRHLLDIPTLSAPAAVRLNYQTYESGDRDAFHHTLLRTYEDTRDCPEVNGVRDLAEIVEGHRAQGIHAPQRWWLALDAGRPVGVLLLAEIPECSGFDLSYLGVVPEARRNGVGRVLTRKALFEARS